jgi:hypothetical protein
VRVKEGRHDAGSSLQDENPWSKLSAAVGRFKSKPSAPEAISALRELLGSNEPVVDLFAAHYLLENGIADEEVGRAVWHIFTQTDYWDLADTLPMLAQLGKTGEAIAVLRSWLAGDNSKLRSQAIGPLERLSQFGEEELLMLVNGMDPSAPQAVSACRKLYRGNRPTESEVASLRALFATRVEDKGQDRDWLLRWIDQKAQALAREALV